MRSTSRAKHYRDKRNHYVNQDQWQIIENVYGPIIDRETFENTQHILDNAPVRRPRGDGEIHPLSGLMYCKDCGSKMYIRIARYALTSSEEFEELIKKIVSAQQSDEEKK